jgi:hypothetical protein
MKLALSCLFSSTGMVVQVRWARPRAVTKAEIKRALRCNTNPWQTSLLRLAHDVCSAPSDQSPSSPSTSTYMRLLASFMFRWQKQLAAYRLHAPRRGAAR